MCGIVAVMGPPGQKLLGILETMLTVDIVRGKDSTGVAAINNKHMRFTKGVLYPLELMRCKQYKQFILNNVEETYCYIGHNRAATRGEVTNGNAHPFMHKNIVMVHNGTLKSHIQVHKDKSFGTDSESIAYAIAHKGIEWTWNNLDGAAALVWYDRKKEALNIIRNDERPLQFMYSKDKKYLFIASETWMIKNVCQRARIKLETENSWKPKEDVMFSFKYDPEKQTVTESSEELEPKKKSYTYTGGRRGRWDATNQRWIDDDDDWLWADFRNHNSDRPNISDKDKKKEEQKRNDFTPFVIGGNGKGSVLPQHDGDMAPLLMDEAEFHSKYKDCFICHESLKDEYHESTIIDPNIAVCGDCAQTALYSGIPLNINTLRGM